MSVGLVVNPLAGIGGPAGLAGSDGAAVQREALRRGGRPRGSSRAVEALRVLAAAHPGAEVLTAAGAMGEDAVREAGLVARVVYSSPSTSTSPDDTARAAAALHGAGATLVLFAGGDGTARDVARGLPSGVPVLGIPAGVKMYSGCFAVAPAAAGALAASWTDGALPTMEAEVLDLDEERMRAGRPDPRLFALVPVPSAPGRTQARKAATPASEREAVHRAATGAAARMLPGVRYLLGPGGTTAELGRVLGLDTTPLGVDVVEDGRLVAGDVTADQALAAIDGRPAQAVVTVIGGQGFVLGRGNQQLSPRVVAALGPRPLLVVATEQKLIDLAGRPLLVDTGDPALDARLAGHLTVVTGPATASIYPVSAATAAPIEGDPECV
ncbi:ATP-NAD kinase family protein [Leifsonia aquatica]|uniref:Putative polyphosphate/ATP-dependent NAD kinase n=1 Tax=Leifsonia aquatica TaxID=144185 RepID=A0A7W4UWR5_LEIAQ|nr:NAD(+)/NADH kinase [Leifsonia aquatica]MBB2967648.1 putative polyphosphate/ATP-dependent NAD kinase [Leifsonia aquatica]